MTTFEPGWGWCSATAHAALAKVAEENPEAELLDTYRDVDLYLTVARALLADSSAAKAVGQSVMNQNADAQLIVQCILNAGSTGVKRVMIYGGERPIDFTQFIVRGHYTRSPLLSNYFRCMMWLGRADCGWNILPTDTATGVVSTGMRELRDAALLVHLVQATNRVEDLESIEALLSFMVGSSDNLTVSALHSVMESAGVASARDLLDSTKMGAVQIGSHQDVARAIRPFARRYLSKPWRLDGARAATGGFPAVWPAIHD